MVRHLGCGELESILEPYIMASLKVFKLNDELLLKWAMEQFLVVRCLLACFISPCHGSWGTPGAKWSWGTTRPPRFKALIILESIDLVTVCLLAVLTLKLDNLLLSSDVPFWCCSRYHFKSLFRFHYIHQQESQIC